MTLRNNVLAILERTFAGHKDEIIKSATDRIMWQFEHQTPDAFIVNGIRYAKAVDTPQTEERCEKCVHFMTNDMGEIWCIGKKTCEKFEPRSDTPQTEEVSK